MFDHKSFLWRIVKLFVCFKAAGASSIFQGIIWSQARLTTSNPGRHGLILMHHFILKPKMQNSQYCFGCLALNLSASLFSCLAVGCRRLWLAEKNRGLWLVAQNSLLTKSTNCGHATSPGLTAEHNCYLRDKMFQCRIVIRQWSIVKENQMINKQFVNTKCCIFEEIWNLAPGKQSLFSSVVEHWSRKPGVVSSILTGGNMVLECGKIVHLLFLYRERMFHLSHTFVAECRWKVLGVD